MPYIRNFIKQWSITNGKQISFLLFTVLIVKYIDSQLTSSWFLTRVEPLNLPVLVYPVNLVSLIFYPAVIHNKWVNVHCMTEMSLIFSKKNTCHSCFMKVKTQPVSNLRVPTKFLPYHQISLEMWIFGNQHHNCTNSSVGKWPHIMINVQFIFKLHWML